MREVPKGFTCECGEFHRFTHYVYAHSEIPLSHHCNNCDRQHTIFAMKAYDSEEMFEL